MDLSIKKLFKIMDKYGILIVVCAILINVGIILGVSYIILKAIGMLL